MKFRALTLFVVVALWGHGAAAQSLSESVDKALAALKAAVPKAEIDFGEVKVNEAEGTVIMTGVTLIAEEEKAKTTIERITLGQVKPSDTVSGISLRDFEAVGINMTPEEGTVSIARIVMKNSNLIDLIPQVAEMGNKAEADGKDEEEIGQMVTRFLWQEGFADELSLESMKADAEDGKFGLGQFMVTGMRGGSADGFNVKDVSLGAPGEFDLKIAEVNSVFSERTDKGFATKSLTKINGIVFVAGAPIKPQTNMVLGTDTLNMNMEIGGHWDTKANTIAVRPFIIDAPDQFRLSFAFDLSGMIPLDEYLEWMGTGDTHNLNELLPKLEKTLAFNGFNISLEERGMVGRLLQMGAMMSGMGDKEQLIGMVEQQGKPQMGMVLGQAMADDLIAKLTAFLREGGMLAIDMKPKSAPLGAKAFQEMSMAPDKAQEYINLTVTHEK